MDEITLCDADGRRPLPQQSCPEKAEQTNHLAWKGSAHVEKPTGSVNQQGISAITADTSLRTVHHRRQIYPTFSLGYLGLMCQAQTAPYLAARWGTFGHDDRFNSEDFWSGDLVALGETLQGLYPCSAAVLASGIVLENPE